MLKDIISVTPLKGHRLHIEFEDGIEGVIDLKKIVDFRGVFKPLKDINFFKKVAINPELGAIFWPNGADLDPDVLYSSIKKKLVSTQH